MIKVIKRDGSIQLWDFWKIVSAVNKAFTAVNKLVTKDFITKLRDEFNPYLEAGNDLTVEDIHNIVQKFFIKENEYEVVEAFIRWRKAREEQREANSDLIKDIRKALMASDIQNQNANVDEASFGGRIGEASRIVTKHEALKMMRKQSRKNHENNEIYIHKKIVA